MTYYVERQLTDVLNTFLFQQITDHTMQRIKCSFEDVFRANDFLEAIVRVSHRSIINPAGISVDILYRENYNSEYQYKKFILTS